MIKIKRLKASTAAFIMTILLIAVGIFPSCVNAFTTDRVALGTESIIGYPPVHDWIIDRALNFLAPTILECIKAGAADQDLIDAFIDDGRRHFVRCMFYESADYINEEYEIIRDMINEDVPDSYVAAKEFGMLLHTVADFYAHSNWVEIWNDKGYYTSALDGKPPKILLLYEPGLDGWYEYRDWDTYKHSLPVNEPINIILAHTHRTNRSYIPIGYTYGYNRAATTAPVNNYLNKLPWVKADNTEYYALITTEGFPCFEPFDTPHDTIAKEYPGSFMYGPFDPVYYDAYWNAIAQTRHEFWRLLNLVKGSDYRGSSAILGYWLRDNWHKKSPHSGLTATVSITNVNFNVPSGKPDVTGYSFIVYAGDFDAFAQRDTDSKGGLPESITLSLDPSDTLVIAVEPYVAPIPGATLWLNGSRLQSGTYHLTNANLDATVRVLINAPEVGPHAEAGGPYGYYSGEEGTPVTLSAEGSYDIGGTITDYAWDLDGDGEYDDGNGITLDHTWSDDFYGTVCLKVTDNDGRSATSEAYVVIENVAPTVEFSNIDRLARLRKDGEMWADIVTYVGEELTLTAKYFDPGPRDNNTYWIHWGGSIQFIQAKQAPSMKGKVGGTISVSQTFSKAGLYNVTIHVGDKDGGFGTDRLRVKVEDARQKTPSDQFDWPSLFAILTSNTIILIAITMVVVAVAVGIALYRKRRAR